MISKVFCIISAASLPFLFSLNSDFVFDDSEAIIRNPNVFSGSWTDAFSHDFWGTDIKTNYSHKSYRPLTILTYRLNYYLNNDSFSAFQYKVTNVLLHISCSILVWKALTRIMKDIDCKKFRKWTNDGAFLAALIFAVHPVHTEAVSGIVGRADILAGNAFFLVLLFYRNAMNTSKLGYVYLLIALSLGAAAMLFKENGITVLGFCLCYDFIVKFKRKKNANTNKEESGLDLSWMIRLVVTVLVILSCLYARWLVMGGIKPVFKPTDNPAAFSNSLLTKILTYNYIYFLNLLLFIWPQWLCYDWSLGCVPLIEDISDSRLIFVLLMYIYGILILRALFNQKIRGTTKRLMLIALLLILIPFLPACNVFYTVGFVLAERVLYISTAGFCLFISMGIKKLNTLVRDKVYLLIPRLFCFLILLFGVRSWLRAEQWRTEYKLFISGVSVCPNNAKIHYNIAKAVDTIDKKWAMDEYNEALRLHPTYYQAMNNLGNLLKAEERYSEAEVIFRTALSIKTDFPTAWMNLGIVLASVYRYNEAETCYMNALRYRKKYPECFYNIGNLYLETNNSERALQSWLQATRLNSTFALAWYNALTLLYDTGQLDRGQALIPKAIEAMPHTPHIYFLAGNIYGKANNFKSAELHFKKAIELFGRDVKAIHYGNLGVLYHRWKKPALAMKMYNKALEIDPNYATCRKNLEKLEKSI